MRTLIAFRRLGPAAVISVREEEGFRVLAELEDDIRIGSAYIPGASVPPGDDG